jgi:Zn finger protein HypA/HybF involved in hydrogenase expression
MHELAQTKELIKILSNLVIEKNIKQLKEAHLVLGELTGLKKEPIEYYFNQISKEDSNLQKHNIKIKFINEKGIIKCNLCHKTSELSEITLYLCPECGSFDCNVLKGDSFFIKKIIYDE